VAAGAGVPPPGLAAASQLGRLADLAELDLQCAGATDGFLRDLGAAAPRLTRRAQLRLSFGRPPLQQRRACRASDVAAGPALARAPRGRFIFRSGPRGGARAVA